MDKDDPDTQLNGPQPVGIRNGFTTPAAVFAAQSTFPLTHVDYLHLTGRPPITETYAINWLFAVLGFALSLSPKFLELLRGQAGPTTNEWLSLAGGAAVALIIYLVGWLLPNSRRDLLKRLKKHFATTQVSYHLGGGKE